jgi:hypothetical protein
MRKAFEFAFEYATTTNKDFRRIDKILNKL